MIKGESIAAIIILSLLGLIFFSLPITYIYDKLGKEENVDYVEIDWENQYPFHENIKEQKVMSSFFKRYDKLYEKIVEKVGNLPKNHLLMRMSMIEAYGTIQKLLGLKIIKDTEETTIYAGNGYWAYLQKKVDTNASFQAVKECKEWLKEKGIDFIFMQAPSKRLNQNIVDNYSMYDNDKDKLCKQLRQAGVDVLDIRSFMPEEYSAYKEKFFKTDHHWKPSSGLWAAGILAEKLNKEYGFQIDTQLLQIENYKREIYPKLFLGSQGRRLTTAYCKPEDIELLIPTFETAFTVTMPKYNIINKTGDFSVLLNKEILKKGDFYQEDLYNVYTYGNQPLITIRNERTKSKKRMLFLKDSFANTTAPYMALVCKEVDILDLRDFTGSFQTYINENKDDYDMVVFLTNSAGNAEKDIDFSEHKNLWDFR